VRDALKIERVATLLFVSEALTQIVEMATTVSDPEKANYVLKHGIGFFVDQILKKVAEADTLHRRVLENGEKLKKFHPPEDSAS
jgi:hypothetical protein